MKYRVVAFIFFTVITLSGLYYILDKGTQTTYAKISDEDAKEFKKIMVLLDGKFCSSIPLDLIYLNRLRKEYIELDFSLKQQGLNVNGYYFECMREGDGYFLRFVDANKSP